MTNITEAGAIASLAEDAVLPRILEPGVIYAIKQPDGIEIMDTDDYAAQPRQVKRTAVASDAKTFVVYLDKRTAAGRTVEVWADLDRMRVVGVLDGGAGWRSDRVELRLKASPEWEAWTKASGKLVGQADLADFLEDWLTAIAEPDAATLMEIVQTIQGTTRGNWKSADWLANGSKSFQWVEEVEGKAGRSGKLEIPSRLTLGLRPFIGSLPYRVVAALRYRMERGSLTIGFKLLEPQRVIETAFTELVEEIDASIAQTIYYGQPD